MDKLIKEHSSSSTYKFCIYPGNNAMLVKRLFESTYSDWEEQPSEDEKYAIQISNFIW